MPRNFKLFGLLAALIALALDQITKNAVLASTIPDQPLAVLPIFNLVLVWNKGVSFGLMTNHTDIGPYVLSLMSLVIAVFFVIWLWRVRFLPLALALGLVIGGALGNVIDRLRFGAVVDFLDFYWQDWHYPAFNIADSCIVIGIAFIVFDGLFWEPRRTKHDKKDEKNNAHTQDD